MSIAPHAVTIVDKFESEVEKQLKALAGMICVCFADDEGQRARIISTILENNPKLVDVFDQLDHEIPEDIQTLLDYRKL